MKKQTQWARFQFALDGLKAAWRLEQSFRTELVILALTVILLVGLQPGWLWWLLVSFSAMAVLAAELVNTALEAVCDAAHPDQHPLIKVAKDCASAAVLVTVVHATIVMGTLVWRLL